MEICSKLLRRLKGTCNELEACMRTCEFCFSRVVLNAFILVDSYTKTVRNIFQLLKGIFFFIDSATVKGNQGVTNVAILGGNCRLAGSGCVKTKRSVT